MGPPVWWPKGTGAREKYSAWPLQIHDNLDHIRVAALGSVRNPAAESGHLNGGVAVQRLNDLGDHPRVDQGLVALDVHHDIAIQVGGDFGNPVEPGTVSRMRHTREAAESFHLLRNARVVGGDHNRVDAGSSGRTGVDMLDHRAACNVGKRFSWKSCRIEAGRDHGDDVQWRGRTFERISERDRRHDE